MPEASLGSCQDENWPMISDRNKIQRIEFAKQCIAARDSFDDVIWTDESSVQLVRHTSAVRVKVGKEQQYKQCQSMQ